MTAVERFVLDHLPAGPARVLEVGCGTGDLARKLSAAGYSVVAIDPAAPEGDIFVPVGLEDFSAHEPFDAVVASRSLHHIEELSTALDKIEGLLRAAGVLVVNEHAWDRLDEPTAQWYRRHLGHGDPGTAGSLTDCLNGWKHDHAGLHGYAAMRSELDRRFKPRHFAWGPYLFGELGKPELEAEERRLIAAGQIQATAFRYVGERP
jgi:SAM-dependent methyltransferase